MKAKVVEILIEDERLETALASQLQIALIDSADFDLWADIFNQTVDATSVNGFTKVGVGIAHENRR